MSEDKPFSINLSRLRTRDKDSSSAALQRSEQAAEDLGFVTREPQKKRGRKPSPRTGQVHAKVMPDIAMEIANEARRRGVVQGILIEEAWELYKNKNQVS
ncbi:MAG: chromosome partitioning protein ParB [Paracoccus sp. (in: a-proteobacteria)]